MRMTDLFLVVPLFVTAAVVGFKFGGQGILVLAGALGLLIWVSLARLVRGEFLSLREKEYVEAARALGLSPYRIIRHVVLVPAVRAVYPALSAQFILQLMGTSICGAIAAEELMAIANNVVMQTFRSFEVYIVIAVIYFVLIQSASLVFAGIGRLLFRWRA